MKKNKLITKFKNWNPSIYATILLLTIPFFYFALKDFKLDNDFWFLINTGKYILNNGFTIIEPFTIHSDFAFIPQQWLTCIIFYLIYTKLGMKGMLLLLLLLCIVIVYLIYKLSILISNKRSISIIITIFAYLMFLLYSITTRPQIFDIIIFISEIYIIEKYIKTNQNKYLYFLPLLSLLLINLHASMWLMFFVLLVPYYIEFIVNKKSIKSLLLLTLLSFAIGFINPYHINAIKYLLTSYGINEINNAVNEMKAININNALLIYIMIFIELIFVYKNKGKNKISHILLFLGTTYLALKHYKGILYLIITMIPLLSNCFTKEKPLTNYTISNKEKIIYICTLVLLVTFIGFNIKIDNTNSLVDVTNYLDKNSNKNIKLFTEYNEGGYLEYMGYKCYIDPRAEVFLKSNNKKEDIFKEYYDLRTGNLDIDDFILKYNFDYLLVNKDENKFLFNYLSNNHDYEDVLNIEHFKCKIHLFKKNINE